MGTIPKTTTGIYLLPSLGNNVPANDRSVYWYTILAHILYNFDLDIIFFTIIEGGSGNMTFEEKKSNFILRIKFITFEDDFMQTMQFPIRAILEHNKQVLF